MHSARLKLTGSLEEFKNTVLPDTHEDACTAHRGLVAFLRKMADLQESTAEGVRVVLSIQLATMEERVNKTVIAMLISASCALATMGLFLLELWRSSSGG